MGTACYGQEQKSELLLDNLRIQLACTEAIDSLYNFNFLVAEKQFGWLQEEYPDHPLGDFLMALSQWWKIMPNDEETKHDERFFEYLESTIDKAKNIHKKDKENPEAAFFLAAAYGFKARRLGDKGKIVAAISPSNKASDYITQNLDNTDDFGPEFLLGHGLYNYFRVWIPENKKSLRKVIVFFKKGDMQLGISQLQRCANEAFYSRIEALIFLMDIYSEYGIYVNGKKTKDMTKGYQIAKNLYNTYPNNSYFKRKYAEISVLSGIDPDKGYEIMRTSIATNRTHPGSYDRKTIRNFNYRLGSYLYDTNQQDQAEKHLVEMVAISEEIELESLGYTLNSIKKLIRYYDSKQDPHNTALYHQKLVDHYDKGGSSSYKKLHKDDYKTSKKYLRKR